MSTNPYQPPESELPLRDGADGLQYCGCPSCGYRFRLRDAADGWTSRMTCRHCRARLAGNWFIQLHPVFLGLFAIVVVMAWLMFAVLMEDSMMLALASGATLIAGFTWLYVGGTLRFGRFRLDDRPWG